MQLIGPADWVFVTLGPYAVISLEAVAYSSYCNTVGWFWWDFRAILSNVAFGIFNFFGFQIYRVWVRVMVTVKT